ncbi:MAG TPA: NEW3 domain-containing protein [Candidatus Limnocylindrales bacterium]|nr:NEW3 domain-containing protein [Candidatus Limnocylindrales bacterium]
MRALRSFLAALLIAAGVVPAALPAAVFAQGPLEMTTDFPSVVADAGTDVQFPVTVTTDTPTRVDLTVTSQPDGWTVRFQGGGSTINAVSTHPTAEQPDDNVAEFTAEVSVPEAITPGSNEVQIDGRTSAGTTFSLVLTVTVEETEPGSVTLETDFPSLEGPTSATFSFNLTLTNDTNTQQTFGLETDAPAGWTVTARPSGEDQAATAVVDAGSNEQISVTVDPALAADAGQYPIIVRAVSDAATAEAALGVEITGSFSLDMFTPDDRLNARVTAGGSTVLNFIVENTGTAPIANLTFSESAPQGWAVTFSPETITSLAPGASSRETIAATITADGDSLAGDYVLTLNANSEDADGSLEIRTTVETSPIGYVIGIAILVIVAIGLFVVFQRYGRR